MLKDITLGQYFPGDSIIHRLDPRTKILFTLIYIVALFMAKSYVSYAVMAAFLITCIKVSKVNPKNLFRGLKPLIIIIIFTGLLNMFYTSGTVLVKFWIFQITKEGIRNAAFMILRIIMLVSGTFLLTFTTAPIALTDGLESLLNPLKKIKLPVHELAMMMSIALRFIPTLIEETDKIMSAQKSRGASFDQGNLMKRAKALIPLFIPLLFNSIRRAYELANAMTCRCYNGGKGKTTMNALKFSLRDYMSILVMAFLIGGIIVLNIFCGEYNAEFTFNLAV